MITLYKYPNEGFRAVIGEYIPSKKKFEPVHYESIDAALATEQHPIARRALQLLGIGRAAKVTSVQKRSQSGGYLIIGRRGSPKAKFDVYYTGLSGPSFVSIDRSDAMTGLTKEAAEKLVSRLNRNAVHHHILFKVQEE